MNIDRKTIATLIDKLVTTNIRCWFAQETLFTATGEEAVQAAKNAQMFNKRRNELMRAIDERLGEGEQTLLGKTY